MSLIGMQLSCLLKRKSTERDQAEKAGESGGARSAALGRSDGLSIIVIAVAEDSVSVSLAVFELSVSLAVDEAVEDVESSLELALLGAALLSLSITKGGV